MTTTATNLEQEEVTFVELDVPVNSHRDAVRYANGREVKIQNLPDGTRFTVVSLALAEKRTPMSQRETGARSLLAAR